MAILVKPIQRPNPLYFRKCMSVLKEVQTCS